MFYFTCNESKIYERFTFWNNLQEKNELFHDILIYWDAPVDVSAAFGSVLVESEAWRFLSLISLSSERYQRQIKIAIIANISII